MNTRDQSKKDYESGMKYKDIADKYNMSVNTLKSWRNRYGWSRGAPVKKKNAPKTKGDASHTKKVASPIIDQLDSNENLTDKQKSFCLYYLQRFNATWAYQKAYEVDYQTAKANGSRLLTFANIKSQLSLLKKQQATELYLTANDVLLDYVKQAKSDVTDVVDFSTVKELRWNKIRNKTGPYRDNTGPYRMDPLIDPETGEQAFYYVQQVHLKDSSEIDTSNIKSVRVDKGEAVVEMYDKQKAMDKLLSYLTDNKLNVSEDKTVIVDDLGDADD